MPSSRGRSERSTGRWCREGEVRAGPSRALDEQPHRVELRHRLDRLDRLGRRERERRHAPGRSRRPPRAGRGWWPGPSGGGTRAESSAAARASSRCSQLSSTPRISVQRGVDHASTRSPGLLTASTSASGGHRADRPRRQLHQPAAVGEVVQPSAATCSARRVLPQPPEPVRVTSRVAGERTAELGHLGFAADEAGELHGQVVGEGVE